MKLAAILVLALLLVAAIAAGFWLYTPDKPRAELEAKYLARARRLSGRRRRCGCTCATAARGMRRP